MLVIALAACHSGDRFDDGERRVVIAAVDSALWSFELAQRTLQAERAIALMAPEFFMYTDGVEQGRDSVAAGIRRSFAGLQHLEPGFADIRIRPLSRTSALSSFRFRDSLMTAEGVVMRYTGATTLLWERRDGHWTMIYGHADHRPVP